MRGVDLKGVGILGDQTTQTTLRFTGHPFYLQTIGGCEYWVFDRSDFSCTLLDSAERNCSGISGPKFPSYEECFDKGCPTLLCDENAKLVNSTQVCKFNSFCTKRQVLVNLTTL